MPDFDWQVALTFGLLLVAALLGGRLAEHLRVPKVTAYLLAGMLLGPGTLNWIRQEDLVLLRPPTRLAISLVLFNLGCHFPMARVRRILPRVVRLSLGELSATFLLVLLGLTLLGAFFGERWEVALLLAPLALATAPATTILVLKENESEGPVTEFASSLVALNNMASIVMFELLFLAVVSFQGAHSGTATELGHLARNLAGAVALGVAGGLLVSVAHALVTISHRLVLLVGVITLLLGICEIHRMPSLLTFLAMGITVANSSDQTRQVLAELDRLTGLLCVVFFVTHGAQLEPELLVEAGWIGLGYIVLRSSGKYFGTRLAASIGHEEPAVRNWLGPSLVAHAAIAIALSGIAVQHTEGAAPALHELCGKVHAVILGSAVVFEIIGPILIRIGVLRAGEVPLAHAIHHSSISMMDQAQTVWNGLLTAAGHNPWKNRSREDLTVGELMRKNIEGVPQRATFDEVVARIEHSHDNTYPVVGRGGELVGVIRYPELSSALFDPGASTLVRAADVTTPARCVLHPDEPVSRVREMFATTEDDCLPVVTREEPCRLVGLLRRRDVLQLLIQSQIDRQER